MSYQEPLSRRSIAIAISDSADMDVLGLAPEHLRDAMTEIARHLLAMGARLVYGGDLRVGGFTELLFELVSRHRRESEAEGTHPAIVSFLAWPIVAAKRPEELHLLASELHGLAEVHFLDRSGDDIPPSSFGGAEGRDLSDDDWAAALTAMRHTMTAASDARIVLGGRTVGFKGKMPGIAEETLTALKAGQPVYLLGGFGGCARDIAAILGFDIVFGTAGFRWPHAEDFRRFGISDLRNGLTPQENHMLVTTVHVDQAVALILRGLLRLAKSKGSREWH